MDLNIHTLHSLLTLFAMAIITFLSALLSFSARLLATLFALFNLARLGWFLSYHLIDAAAASHHKVFHPEEKRKKN